ncbi:hypothetical protein KY347_01385 [Candidatus Woesearchaeota archaeon]|nr:hypothetical protein [Candidatus Woesearchaeota archaeon]
MKGLLVILIFLLTILAMSVNRRLVYSRKLKFLDIPYYLAPILGSFLIFLFGGLNLGSVYSAIMGYSFSEGLAFLSGDGPFSIVILFLSITFIALALDVSGVFKYLAVKVLKKVHGSGIKLFIGIYLMTSILTLFTSNDILILTLTPFLLVFFRHLDINPTPFLIAEFFAANIFSMGLLIGNPTNIIVATSFELNFIEYLKIMILPAFIAGLTTFILLFIAFRKDICIYYKVKRLPDVKLSCWGILSITLLSGTILSLAVLSLRGFLLWHISLAGAILTILLFGLPNLFITLKLKTSLKNSYICEMFNKMPWEIVPFVFGFFLMIKAFSLNGISYTISNWLSSNLGQGLFSSVFGIGILSTLSANVFNNIPMTIFFSGLLENFGFGKIGLGALYSLIMGSNLGANLTPIGALAGIMWVNMLNRENIKVGFNEFLFCGIKVTLITTLITLVSIYIFFVLY